MEKLKKEVEKLSSERDYWKGDMDRRKASKLQKKKELEKLRSQVTLIDFNVLNRNSAWKGS